MCGIVLAWLCSMSDAVNVKVLSTKAVGKSGDTFQLKGKCTLKMPTDMLEPRGGQLTIQFDKETMKFKVFGVRYKYAASLQKLVFLVFDN